jgi:predicted transcriptional regulator
MKNSKQLERHLKGVSNHRRIDILLLINKSDNIKLEDIAEILECNLKTIAGHTSKLVNAGLVNKRHQGLAVMHSLSPYGKIFIEFILKLANLESIKK